MSYGSYNQVLQHIIQAQPQSPETIWVEQPEVQQPRRARYFFISCDGTLNHRDRSAEEQSKATNAQILEEFLPPTAQDGSPVIKMYMSGVGTGGAGRNHGREALKGDGTCLLP
jgi:hypothetical protein